MPEPDETRAAFEADFAHDAWTRCRVDARRSRLLADWAAARRGLEGAEAARYVRAAVKSEFDPRGEAALMDKLAADLDGIASAAEIRSQAAACQDRARDEILGRDSGSGA